MNGMQITLLKKDIRSITTNKNLVATLLIVPLFMTIILPTILILMAGLIPMDSDDFIQLLTMLPAAAQSGPDMRKSIATFMLDNIIPIFFLIIPIMSSTVMAASSFVGEKEKRTLETLLYCPLSLKQIFGAKILSAVVVSQCVSLLSFAAMQMVVQTESWFLLGSLLKPSGSWIVLLLLVSPALSLVAITLIVRGSAKAKSMEESQQRSVFLVLPIILLAAGQFSGLFMLSIWILLGVAFLCTALGLILLRRASVGFSYERLLQ